MKQLSELRRVVTGNDQNGRSTVIFDGPPPRTESPAQIWRTGEPSVGASQAADGALAPIRLDVAPHASLFWIVRMPPGHGTDRLKDEARAQRLADMGASTPDDHSGVMHATTTIDYVVVLEGEVSLILDDTVVTLSQHDCVVQRGTAHAWENRSSEPALLAFVLVGQDDAST
jgi:hypothetical protein